MATNTEATFRNLISILTDATGGNAAFDPKYGMDTLNEIRVELSMDRLDEAKMREVLGDE